MEEQEIREIRIDALNHFISDCQRAGIELTFKKEIEDKLC